MYMLGIARLGPGAAQDSFWKDHAEGSAEDRSQGGGPAWGHLNARGPLCGQQAHREPGQVNASW